jgi:hypothetical protein
MRLYYGPRARRRIGRRGRRNGYPRRSKLALTYHSRTGKPLIHMTDTNKRYIMVRAKGGGTKRLYEGSQYAPAHKPRSKKIRLVLNGRNR